MQNQNQNFGGNQNAQSDPNSQNQNFQGSPTPPPQQNFQGQNFGGAPNPQQNYGMPPQQNFQNQNPQNFQNQNYGMPPQQNFQGPPMPPPPALGPDGKPLPPIGHFGRQEKVFQTAVKLPKHNLKFDENLFLRLLAGSISLTKDEKKKVIESVARLDQGKVDQLINILKEEKRKFSELDTRHAEQLTKLEKQAKIDWDALEAEYMSADRAGEEKNQAAAIRAQLSGQKSVAPNPPTPPKT